jgi:alpha-tubulin suppressor-like RCC1 family protein
MEHNTFIKTTDGYYVFGYNEYYQLGLGHNNNVNIPTKLEFEHEIYSIIPGNYHAFFITSDGLYCSRKTVRGAVSPPNHCGQLGLGIDDRNVTIFTKVDFEHEIYSITCGQYYTLFMTSDGVYTCGFNRYGTLGLGHNDNVSMLTKVNLEHDVILNDRRFKTTKSAR